MSHRRVGRDHEVEILNHRRRVHEWTNRRIEPIAQIDDREISLSNLFAARPLLQTDEPQAVDPRQRRKPM